jgi:short subunit dehydrogenase-like uncharacterized protein
MVAREFDVVVFGATSVTGREVCRYLSRRPGVRWAAAGRDAARVRSVLGALGVSAPDVLLADSGDAASLAALAARTTVLLNLVGPYVRSAEAVIAACVTAGTSYIDLSGEIPFVRRMRERFHEAAVTAGVKIVQVCGFEAMPPDLAVRLAAEVAHERHGEPLASVDAEIDFVRLPRIPRPSDMLSGGTLQSIAAIMGDPDGPRAADPALLVTDPARAAEVRARSPLSVRARRSETGRALGPVLPAASITPPVIQLSAELAGEPVFRFREAMVLPGRGVAALPALAIAGVLAGVTAGLLRLGRMSQARRERLSAWLERTLPGAGFGPATDRLDKFAWTITLHATSTGGHPIRVEVEGDGHPGYLTTATALGEAGALLAEPGATPTAGGCLSPAVALGTACAPRFAAAGLRFRVV